MSTSPGGMLAGGIGSTGGTYVWLQGRNTGAAGVSYPISLNPLGGNVGIGTATPSYPLHLKNATFSQLYIEGGSAADLILYNSGGSANTRTMVYRQGTGGTAKFFSANDAGTINKDNILVLDNSTGNVGIGTTTPETLLHVNSSNAGGEGGYIYLDNPAASTLNNKSGIKFGTSSGASFSTTPTGEISNIVTNAGTGASDLTFGTFDGSSSGERMRISSAGRITMNGGDGKGLIIEANSAALSIPAIGFNIQTGYNVSYINSYNISGVLTGIYIGSSLVNISSLGTGTVTATAGTLSTVSDSAYKIDAGFIDSALDKVMNLKPRYFYWNEKSGLPKDVKQLGFYAQEVNEALGEEAANTPATEDIPWGITDRSVIAMLTKAIQELKAEIDLLKGIAPIEPIVPEVTTQIEPESEPIIPTDED